MVNRNGGADDTCIGSGDYGPGVLDNALHDPSYLNQALGSEIFRAAGVPAARVAFAVRVAASSAGRALSSGSKGSAVTGPS